MTQQPYPSVWAKKWLHTALGVFVSTVFSVCSLLTPNMCALTDGVNAKDKFSVCVTILGLHMSHSLVHSGAKSSLEVPGAEQSGEECGGVASAMSEP